MASSARIDELRKKFDENPRRYFAPLANEFRKAGDLEQAVFICQEYLPQQPGHMSGHIVYGQALFELGRDEEAKAVFETALSLDPENLIALRHLGDIARQAGDLDVARFWYQRVLESDPRNEEIAQVLMSMDAGASQPAPAAVEPPPLPEPSTIAMQESATAVEEPAEPATSEPEEPGPIAAAAPPPDTQSYEPFEGFDRNIDFDQPNPDAAVEPEPPDQAEAGAEAPAPVESAAEPPQPVSAHADEQAADDELLDLDDFSIGGAPVGPAAESEPALHTANDQVSGASTVEFGESTVASDATAITNEAIESVPAQSYLDEQEPLADDALFDITGAGATFEPESAQAPTPSIPDLVPEVEPEPVIELAGDIHLGLPPDESAALTEFRPEPEPQPTAEPVAVGSREPATAAEAQPSEPADEVFATETMANLYVQQGHLAEALAIYEKLLARDPSDATLQRRIHDVRERIYRKSHDAVWEPKAGAADLVPSPAAASTPTIREFLRGLIARRTAEVAPSSAPADAELADAPSQAAPAETVTGSIDALFANASPSEDDRSAANALAQAFGEWPEPTPIQGVPAHEASSELSLDHVFKANAPVPRRDDTDAFSFDQFFSGDLAEGESGTERAPGGESAGGGDDIAQFNTWLNGLKKT